MTINEPGLAEKRPVASVHPLASLSSAEFDVVRGIVNGLPYYTESTRFSYVGLEEPPKHEFRAWMAGDVPAPDRRARVWLQDVDSGKCTDLVISLSEGAVVGSVDVDGSRGRLPVLDSEAAKILKVLAENKQWIDALAARGVTPADVKVIALPAGNFGYAEEEGRLISRCLAFRMDHKKDHPWAHPVDGVSAYVDLTGGAVLKVIDTHVFDIPAESGNYDDPEVQGPPLEGLKPIEITQPEGPSFSVDGEHVTWANWKFRVGFDVREGLVLHQVTFNDQGVDRSVMYRGSISEMVVPYGDPGPNRFWQNYFDAGEIIYGRFTSSLELGCDCVGEIKYFDGLFADEAGVPRRIANAICMHEEDYGSLWKHTDPFTGANEVRRSRRLVISFFTNVGNYDYGFFWYLYLDGTIECEAKLTGILFTSAYPGDGDDGPYPFASEVAPGLGAPYHQHLFNARLDLDIDGSANVVNEIDAVRLPISESNPNGNAFTKSITPIVSERDSGRVADGGRGRVWQIASTDSRNRLGHPASYVLHPVDGPTLMADDSSWVAKRAAFATKHLFVTKYDPAERYASGDFVTNSPAGEGIPDFISGDESLVGQDLVLWHTFGLTHFPRAEDWPIMPMDYAKFSLRPYNFFDRNPTLNVPAPSMGGHCTTHTNGANGTNGHAS
ncbi:primary-amine oxidase [Gordonia terrae]|uniref:Amine oxidase n=2 Tax=Gordonia terrae TaxID=2055 RepID=A0AAD0NWR4_9ACTN|nr:primary-amine oxidase [Gordonia terrae]VTR09591.1 Histamine oxidase [Clostridioides difficile]ANY22202.1 tyramine oxidase [Gordonia terrae]AWO82943.1 tyramine oxidase [Gordonia terrae]VTS29616.1 Histamine oxidase [Gordonia terrae]GAB46331.1 putative copper-containing amine oxidase [Gordonia terrae NBRC 100016]